MKLWWWACMAFAISVSLAVGSFLLLHSWQGQVNSWVERQHTYLWERSRPDRPPASTYAYYQHCGPPPEQEQQVMPHAFGRALAVSSYRLVNPIQEATWAVFHCEERASVGHWPGCIAQAWSIHTLAQASGCATKPRQQHPIAMMMAARTLMLFGAVGRQYECSHRRSGCGGL
jgi:hypothetical protein